MSDWTQRLGTQITITAPDGSWWSPYWAGNDIEGGKRVGLFDYPLIDGTWPQDLGLKGLTFPLTLQFEGIANDKDAMGLMRALKQKGNWTVTHPVYGDLTVQPLSPFTLKSQPVTSGNITIVESLWLEIPPSDTTASSAELSGQIGDQFNAASLSAGAQFTQSLDITDPDAMAQAMTSGLAGLNLLSGSGLNDLISSASNLTATVTTAYASATAALESVPLDVIDALSNIQTLMGLPASIEADLSAKIAAYAGLAGEIIASIVPGADASSRNAAVVNELFLSGCLTGVALSVASTTPTTRDQAIQAITDITALFTNVTTALDAVQTANAGNVAAQQYFSNGVSFSDLVRLVGLACAYLLQTIFNLKIATYFTLDRPRACIDLVIQYYGTEYDANGGDNYGFFIATNKLQGQNVMLLPAGHQVVVYV